jgi:hypothetical protein
VLVRESYLLRIASDPVARVWSGHGDLVIPADIVESAQATYLGAGELLNAPDFQHLINGTAQRLEFRLSGVSSRMLALAVEDAPSVKHAAVHIGRADFGPDWQLVGVEWEAVFRADSLSVVREEATRTIILSIGSEDTGRSRAPNAFFTDADQRQRSSTDAIFSNVGKIYSGTTRRFGPK